MNVDNAIVSENTITQNEKPAYLELDETTLVDLEIFESKGGQSLFQFCNKTRLKGGGKALRKRMEKPWATKHNIEATQKSLSFILHHRTLFNTLPENYTINNVESYTHGQLPIVLQTNLVEFTLSACGLWMNNDSHFFSISRGVQMACQLISGLTNFLSRLDAVVEEEEKNGSQFSGELGELALLISELRRLLTHEHILKLPDEIDAMASWQLWKILRLDQVFRIHEKHTLARLLGIIYEIDALVAMADCTEAYNFVLPKVNADGFCVNAEGLVHPYLDNAVANPVQLNSQITQLISPENSLPTAKRGLFLTGPNMAGKTTYLRAFAIATYFAHLGMGVPAKRFHFTAADKLISSISLADNLHSGVSFFRAEALRVKDIAQAVVDGYRVIAVIDEPFKGTNVKDTYEASLAMLKRFASCENFLFMFSSHQIELGEQLISNKDSPIDCRYFSAIETEERLRFDYQLREGVAKQRIGMRVLTEEGVFELFDSKL